MCQNKYGGRTFALRTPPSVAGHACVVGKKEGEGPLKDSFDEISDDSFFGEKTWEKAESVMQKRALKLALEKAELPAAALGCVFAGDLLNQCIGSSYGLRDSGVPFFGLYGACSTMSEGLALAAMTVDGGYADAAAALTSSHFCAAERQFRFPLEYGGQRTPAAQWTVTGAGAVVLTSDGPGPYLTHITPGVIVDAGVKDMSNMGAAMAPAAYDTLRAHFAGTGVGPADYDLIVTGDLGWIGGDILTDFFRLDGVDLAPRYTDCGMMIFSREAQDVHAGGSGCGCSASVLCGHLLNGMHAGIWRRVLFAATGALMSTVSSQQGESIPAICCAVTLSNTR